MDHEMFQQHIRDLYAIVDKLEKMFPGRAFTPDGHMVGSIGECLVADAYGLELMPQSNEGYDAITRQGGKVEIKATQGKSVAFRSCPDHIIIIRILRNGKFEEFYNGPGHLIWRNFEGKKIPKNGQFQISLSKVREINAAVPESERVMRGI